MLNGQIKHLVDYQLAPVANFNPKLYLQEMRRFQEFSERQCTTISQTATSKITFHVINLPSRLKDVV